MGRAGSSTWPRAGSPRPGTSATTGTWRRRSGRPAEPTITATAGWAKAFSSPHRLARELAAGRWRVDPDKARELSIYLANNGDHLYTYRLMGPGRWMCGSAPAEKHIELTV